jgi:lipopolysaccharide cholinephosphotransferase
MWDQFVTKFIYFGMPVVAAYHLVTGNVFINTAAQDATGFEKAGNLLLTPVHYLLAGKIAVLEDGNYRLEQQFDYSSGLMLKTTVSVIGAPLALPVGCLFKGIGFLSQEVRDRHQKILAVVSSRAVHSNVALYEQLGLPLASTYEPIDPPAYQRRPGEENTFALEKELLRDIVRIFDENKIIYWVDTGTCLGAYRYGGFIPWDKDVDVAILMPDFQNAFNALKALDPEKYQAQDWSSRCHPQTYIRVFVRETRNHIDIYNFSINPEDKTLTYFCPFMDSSFMTTSWKTYESRFINPTAFDTIFPLRKAQFDGIDVCVPNKTKLYLQERYGEDIGPIKIYNEVTQEYEKDLSHPYWQRSCVY